MHNYVNQLIGLAGRAETGKDTAAIILRDALELRTYTFAEPVTRKCAQLLDMEHHEFLMLPKKTPCSIGAITKRELMQHMGADLRKENKYFATEYVQHQMDCNEDNNYLFNGQLITDVRLPLEVDWVRSKSGIIIHIKNPNAEPAPADITEQDLEIQENDYVLINDKDKQTFENRVRSLAIQLRAQITSQAA